MNSTDPTRTRPSDTEPKLGLRRATLRTLTGNDLRQVVGGTTHVSGDTQLR